MVAGFSNNNGGGGVYVLTATEQAPATAQVTLSACTFNNHTVDTSNSSIYSNNNGGSAVYVLAGTCGDLRLGKGERVVR